VVEEDDEEDEGRGGQGIGAPIYEDMECDNDGVDDDGGHVSEDSSWLREVEFIEGEIEVQSEGTRDKGEGTTDKGEGESEGLRFKCEVRHRHRRHASNPIEGLKPNCTNDLQDLDADDDESEGTFVHDRELSDTEWESEELDIKDEFEDGEEDINTCGKFPSFQMPKNMADFFWDVGTYFTEKETLRDAIRTYDVHSGRNLKLVKEMIIREFGCVVLEHKDNVNGLRIVGSYPQQDDGR